MPILELPPPPPSSRAPLSPSSSRSLNNLPSALPNPTTKLQRLSIGSTLTQAQYDATLAEREDEVDELDEEEQDREEEEEDVSMDLANSQSQSQGASQMVRAAREAEAQQNAGEEEEADSSRTLEQEQNGEGEDETLRSQSRSTNRSRRSSRSGGEEDLTPLHIEVRLKATSTLRYDLIRSLLSSYLDNEYETVLTHSEVHDWRDVGVLEQNVDRVWIGECALPTSAVPLSSVSLHLHIYQPPSSSRLTEFSTSPNADEDGDSDVPAASVLELPSLSLEGVWDSLIYEGGIKEKLLSYIYSTMLFSDATVDFNIVTWHRLVLLHGPPGTGKTSLCRALAQKLAIRLSERYQSGRLIEINSHSLFSKWFSESGKLVQRLFSQVNEMVDDEECFVVVLIDEVESLTAARAGAMSGKEPSDALRVVNALLTQLDKLKSRKNCLVMTTSNLSGAIDNAFIDRADIKQYIGLPPAAAVYWILQSCLKELMRASLIPAIHLHSYTDVELFRSSGRLAQVPSGGGEGGKQNQELCEREWSCSEKLFELANQCQGLSGRTLRRLPVLAHARHLSLAYAGARPRLEKWLDAMRLCVEEEGREMEKVEGGEGGRG